MKILTRSLRTLNQVNRSIWLLPNKNPPILRMRNMFHPDLHNNKQDHTQELLTSHNKKKLPTPKEVIEEDDYDLLACPPENLIHPDTDKILKPKEEP